MPQRLSAAGMISNDGFWRSINCSRDLDSNRAGSSLDCVEAKTEQEVTPMAELVQMQLLQPDHPVNRILLGAADSPKCAYYEVACHYLPGAGYLIRKSSGGSGCKGNIEMWFRPNLRGALQKQLMLIQAKLKKRGSGKRVYSLVSKEGIQL